AVPEIEDELRRCGRLRSNETRTWRQSHGTDVMIDADKRGLALVDDGRESAEARNVPNVERGDDVGALDLFDRARARVGTFGDEEVESLWNASRVRDRHTHAARPQRVPQRDLAADAVAISVHMRRP